MQAVLVGVPVDALRWMELKDGFVVRKEERLDETHLVPARRPIELLPAPIDRYDRDMIPAHAVGRDDLEPGLPVALDQEGAIVAVLGATRETACLTHAIGLNAQIRRRSHRPSVQSSCLPASGWRRFRLMVSRPTLEMVYARWSASRCLLSTHPASTSREIVELPTTESVTGR